MKPLLLVPLDDRPCCRQFVERLAGIANWPLVVAPNHLLGCFLQPGQPEQLQQWFSEQLEGSAGAIVSLDMICYGGLVASRQATPSDGLDPQGLLETFVALLGHKHPAQATQSAHSDFPVWASNTIMRTAPTQSTSEQVRYAAILLDLSVRLADSASHLDEATGHKLPSNVEETLTQLVDQLPKDYLRDYLKTRKRNHRINCEALKLTKQRSFVHLLLGIDDSKTKGWNILEMSAMQPDFPVGRANIAPGTDENALLLLSQAIGHLTGAPPRRFHLVVSEQALAQIGSYEDRPLKDLLASQMVSASLQTTSQPHDPSPFYLFIYSGPQTQAGQPEAEHQDPQTETVPLAFLERLQSALDQGGRVVVADIAYANGGSLALGKCLAPLHDRLLGYSAWNTTGNTIGTALALIGCASPNPSPSQRRAEQRFCWERLLDDLVYQSQVRSDCRQTIGQLGLHLTAAESQQIQSTLKTQIEEAARAIGFPQVPNFEVALPWNRLFEIEIQVKL